MDDRAGVRRHRRRWPHDDRRTGWTAAGRHRSARGRRRRAGGWSGPRGLGPPGRRGVPGDRSCRHGCHGGDACTRSPRADAGGAVRARPAPARERGGGGRRPQSAPASAALLGPRPRGARRAAGPRRRGVVDAPGQDVPRHQLRRSGRQVGRERREPLQVDGRDDGREERRLRHRSGREPDPGRRRHHGQGRDAEPRRL